jgi:methionyl aminopeptidase
MQPGITTEEIDRLVHEAIVRHNAYPSPLLYPSEFGSKYPKSVCTSVNNVVCHGIPDDIPLQEGDTLNIDVTVYRNGFHGDCSATYPVGQVSPKATRLMKAAKEGLDAGINACGPGKLISNIGRAIQYALQFLFLFYALDAV